MKLDPKFEFADPLDATKYLFRSLFWGLAQQARWRKKLPSGDELETGLSC